MREAVGGGVAEGTMAAQRDIHKLPDSFTSRDNARQCVLKVVMSLGIDVVLCSQSTTSFLLKSSNARVRESRERERESVSYRGRAQGIASQRKGTVDAMPHHCSRG